MTSFVDSHAHIQEPEFDGEREALIQHAHAAGVDTIIVPGVDFETSLSAIRMSDHLDGIYATVGYHPHEAIQFDSKAPGRLDWLLSGRKVVALGEIGLDFYRDLSPREVQIAALASQLELAAHWRLPVIIHCRDAWDALDETLIPWAKQVASDYASQPLGVLHYYSSDLETARRYVDLGFLISIHTSVTHPKATMLREVAAALPLESLVIETDSPYGAPQAYRGKRNEPAYVVEAAKQIATLKGVSLEEVAEATSANARRLFRLPVPAEASA